MKLYLKAFLLVLFAVTNYYGLKFGFLALNYPKDVAFLAGLVGLVVLLVSDILIVRRVVRNFIKKVETQTNETK
jgi:phosphoglycerol transferase MdoB-like AlkP superfamily enzyme